jgi:seryl-tRNA synthetase
MLDIKFIKENSELIKKDLKRRHDDEKVTWVGEVINKFDEWKKLKEDSDKLRHDRNLATREINQLKKDKKDFLGKVKEAKEIADKIDASERDLEELQTRVGFILQRLPNLLHESVPVGKDDTENQEIRKWGKVSEPSFKLKNHGELLEQLGLADFDRASKISGTGFHFLKGDLVKLELALINFVSGFIEKKGFTLIQPPSMMWRKPYESVIELEAFENVMYKVDGEESYMIATSEHPIAAMFKTELLDEKELPIKLCGISTCFRKEIGSHGVDTRGLFRVHQFNKVEQFIFSKPEDSWKIHEELLKNSEEIMQKLKIPYRVVNVCSGDIGAVAAKKYDIEAWFPRQKDYGEVVSCSNCTSYQSVGLNIKYLNSKTDEKEHVHTLNSTAVATGRIMVAIAENYQNEDGTITVPDVLIKFMGKKVIGK